MWRDPLFQALTPAFGDCAYLLIHEEHDISLRFNYSSICFPFLYVLFNDTISNIEVSSKILYRRFWVRLLPYLKYAVQPIVFSTKFGQQFSYLSWVVYARNSGYYGGPS